MLNIIDLFLPKVFFVTALNSEYRFNVHTGLDPSPTNTSGGGPPPLRTGVPGDLNEVTLIFPAGYLLATGETIEGSKDRAIFGQDDELLIWNNTR